MINKSSKTPLAIALSLLLAPVANAADVQWNGASDSNWGNSSNWQGGAVPVAGDNTLVTDATSPLNGNVSYGGLAGETVGTLHSLLVDGSLAGVAITLEQTSGTLSTTTFNLGLDGNASVYNLSGGTLNVNPGSTASTTSPLMIGRNVGSEGTLNQSGGTTNVNFDAFVGFNGKGTYNLNNGSGLGTNLAINGSLLLGSQGVFHQSAGTTAAIQNGIYDTGTINFDDGDLKVYGAQGLNVGSAGLGKLNQSGGAIEVTQGSVVLGLMGYASGQSQQDAGTLTIDKGNLNIGDLGGGSYYQSNSQGYSSVYIGQDIISPPPVDHSGDSWTTGNLYIGGSPTPVPNGQAGGSGSYTIRDYNNGNPAPTLTVTGEIFIGGNNQGAQFGNPNSFSCQSASTPCYGDFNQDGGTVTVDHSGNPDYQYYADIQIGIVGGKGTYNLFNGTLITPNTIEIGNTSTDNHFNQYGGVVNTGQIILANATGSEGTYLLSGGELNAGGIVGDAGTGVIQNSGGIQNAPTSTLYLGYYDTASGTYILDNAASELHLSKLDLGVYGYGEVNQSAGQVTSDNILVGGDWDIDAFATGTGHYKLSGGSVTVYGGTQVGATSTGRVTQTGGLFNAGSLDIGASGLWSSGGPEIYTLHSDGTYDLQGGVLNTSGTVVGDFGVGAVTQDDSAGSSEHNVNGDLVIGSGPALTESNTGIQRHGSYTLNQTIAESTSSLNVKGNFYIGAGNNNSDWAGQPGGLGTMTQNGGSVSVGNYDLDGNWVSGGDLIVGQYGSTASGNGTYNLSGGTLKTNSWVVAEGGALGVVNQSGGSATVIGFLTVGQEAGSDGTYNLGGTGALTTGNAIIGGGLSGGHGYFQQSDSASSYITDFLNIGGGGFGLKGDGIYQLDNGNLQVNANMVVGNDVGGHGSFIQNGGTVNVNSADFGLFINNGNYTLNPTTGLSVTSSIAADSVLNVTNNLYVGDVATASFTQNGGTNTVGNQIIIANNSAAIGSNFDLKGGSLSANSIIVKTGGTFNFTGGSLTLSGGQGIFNSGNTSIHSSNPSDNLTVNGNVNNAGSFHVTNTNVTYTGTFNNSGSYQSDPSVNTFNDLTVSTTGYLVGGTGDQFVIQGSYSNTSTQNALWDTSQSLLTFSGSGIHNFNSYSGVDFGQNASGYVNNFAWGGLDLGNGVGLNISGTGTLYVGLLGLDEGLTQLNRIYSDTNIYYDATLGANAYLNGLAYQLNGSGYLKPISPAPVPIPTAVWLFGSAIAGLTWLGRRKS